MSIGPKLGSEVGTCRNPRGSTISSARTVLGNSSPLGEGGRQDSLMILELRIFPYLVVGLFRVNQIFCWGMQDMLVVLVMNCWRIVAL